MNRLNEGLGLTHRLSVWQFNRVRRNRLAEVLDKIDNLYLMAHGCPYAPPTDDTERQSITPYQYRLGIERRAAE